MKNKILTLLTVLTVFMTSVVYAEGIAVYDASVGNPSVAGDVQDPLDQGWSVTDGSLGVGDIQEGLIEGGIAAWRNLDGTANNNPGYVIALTADNYQDMFDFGWTLTITTRLEQGGQFMYWGGDASNTGGGFNFPGDRRVGFAMSASGNDYTATIVSTGSAGAITITDGIINDTYITVILEGIAGTSTFNATILDTATSTVLSSETGLGFANGNSSTDAHTGFMSGSSAGDNREAFYREFKLELPSIRITETDGGTFVAEGLGTDTYDIVLAAEPNDITSPVVVTITPDSQVSVDITEVVFPAWTGDPNDYTVTVTVTAVDDLDIEYPIHTGVITHFASSDAALLDVGAMADVTVSVADDDGTPGVTINKSLVVTSESGDTDTFTLVLDTPPTSGVTVNFVPDAQVGAIGPVDFNDLNWATPQTITVPAEDDLDSEDTPHFGMLAMAITSSDADYSALVLPVLTVAVVDNDNVGPTAAVAHAWYKADAGTMDGLAFSADGGEVKTWMDQAGNGRDLFRMTSPATSWPDYVEDGGYTGVPTVTFDGTERIWASKFEFSDGVSATVPLPATVFLVATMDTLASQNIIAETSSTGNFSVGQSSAGKYTATVDGGSIVSEESARIGSRTVLTAVFNSADSGIYLNGELIASGNLTSNDAGLSPLMVGSPPFSGEIAEIIWYSQLLGDTDRQEVEAYLMDKYLGKIALYESAGSTEVTESAEPVADTYEIEVFGTPTGQVDVTVAPTGPNAGDVDLGNGPGTAIVLNFATAGIQTVTVNAVNNDGPDGPRDVTITHTASSSDAGYVVAISDVVVTVTDDEEYCGQPGTVYHSGDLNKDCYVNIEDVAIMAAEWLACTDPVNQENCFPALPLE